MTLQLGECSELCVTYIYFYTILFIFSTFELVVISIFIFSISVDNCTLLIYVARCDIGLYYVDITVRLHFLLGRT